MKANSLRRFTLLLLLILVGGSSSALALTPNNGPKPPNNPQQIERSPEEWSRYLRVPLQKFLNFNQVLDRIEQIYGPMVQATGDVLEIQRLWHARNYAISVNKIGNRKIIYVTGGVIRHPGLNEHSFAMMACHETGHHLGGYPKQPDREWSTSEGQADYFATTKCMRSIFSTEEAANYLANVELDSLASNLCKKQFRDTQSQTHCLHSAMTALEVAYYSLDIENPKFENADRTEVPETLMKWPPPQCRLDTMLQGALCKKSKDEMFSNSDPHQGACLQPQVGARPRCWYLEPQ